MIDKARRLPHLLLTLMSAFMLTAWEPTAQAQSQKAPVSMSLKAVPVKTVLDQLKKQTGLNFIYSTDLAKTWPKVSINVRGVSPRRVLDLLMGEINCPMTWKAIWLPSRERWPERV
jgi:type II secretory pathway component GspD/PulD (secretin)